jgi:hypothetical protein
MLCALTVHIRAEAREQCNIKIKTKNNLLHEFKDVLID